MFVSIGLSLPQESTMKYLEQVAIQIARDIANGKIKVDRAKKGLVQKITASIMQMEMVKNMIFKKAKEQVMKASRGLYPAPLKVSSKINNTGFNRPVTKNIEYLNHQYSFEYSWLQLKTVFKH